MDTWRDRMKRRYQELRSDKGLTQQQIADAMGRSQGAIGNWLGGDGAPRIEELEKLADVLECDVVWLVFGDAVYSRYTLAQVVGKLSPEQQERLVALAQVMQ